MATFENCPDCGADVGRGTVPNIPDMETLVHGNKNFRVRVVWDRDQPDLWQEYSFKTKLELDSFVFGCNEAAGYIDFTMKFSNPQTGAFDG